MDKKRKIIVAETRLDLNTDTFSKRQMDNDTPVQECFEFDRDDPVSMFQILVHNSHAAIQEPPTNTKDVQRRIVELKNQIDHLFLFQEVLTKFVNKTVQELQNRKEQELSGLLDSSSSLLSLGHTNVSKIVDFLDADDLYVIENTSYTLNQIMFENKHWERIRQVYEDKNQLFENSRWIPIKYWNRPPRFLYNNSRTLEDDDPQQDELKELIAETRLFGLMMAKARQWEALGEEYYNYDLQHIHFDFSNESFLVHANDCRRDSSSLAPGPIEGACGIRDSDFPPHLFIRLSLYDGPHGADVGEHQDNSNKPTHKVVWQGFAGWEGRETFHYSISLTDELPLMDWACKTRFLESLITPHASPEQLENVYEDCLESLLADLRVTVLVMQGSTEQLLFTSGGHYKSELFHNYPAIVMEDHHPMTSVVEGYLHPRSFTSGEPRNFGEIICPSVYLAFSSEGTLQLGVKNALAIIDVSEEDSEDKSTSSTSSTSESSELDASDDNTADYSST